MGNLAVAEPRQAAWTYLVLGGTLAEDDLRALADACRLVHVAPQRPLLRAGDDRAAFVLEGTGKAHTVTREGDQVITAMVEPGHAAGLVVAIGHGDAGSDVTALTPMRALLISGPDLRRLLDQRPGIMAACLATISQQHATAMSERRRFAGTSISQRVAQRLLELATRWGRVEGDRVVITLSLTQEELASWSGASRESVAKALQGMRATGLLTTGRRSLTILDLPRLRQRCERPHAASVHRLLARHP
jgi:CRP/FNR family transcriptional regulator, cyclic AMP receptor protein